MDSQDGKRQKGYTDYCQTKSKAKEMGLPQGHLKAQPPDRGLKQNPEAGQKGEALKS